MRTLARLAAAAIFLALAPRACAFTLEEIVHHMNATSESIKDVEATAKVTKFDSVFETTTVTGRKLFFQRPHLARVDTYETRKGKEVLAQQFILGKDFALQVWLETKHGELRKLSAEDIARMDRDRNDPISLFGKNIDEIRKDFNIELAAPPKDAPVDSALLVIKPVNKEVKFDYAKIEMLIDTKTWLPRSIKSFVGTDKDDWTLYQFTAIKLNPGLRADTFEPPAGIRIEVVEKDKPTK
jgi:outer membrane lipoprotein-sorting protein